MKLLSIFLATFLFSNSVFSAVQKEQITYKHGDTQLEGYMFWDDSFNGKRPGILIFPEEWGINDYPQLRAEMLAENGYAAFVADMFGNSRLSRKPKEASVWVKKVSKDVNKWRERAKLGLEQLVSHEKVNTGKIAALGYSFGGSTAMQLAYTGAELNGVVVLHTLFPPAKQEELEMINSKILILHGDADPFMSRERFNDFQKALSNTKIDWVITTYSGAKHSFSNPYADGYGIDGLEYNIDAEKRSWIQVLSFFKSLFET
jgi:dienelactone hydrolase